MIEEKMTEDEISDALSVDPGHCCGCSELSVAAEQLRLERDEAIDHRDCTDEFLGKCLIERDGARSEVILQTRNFEDEREAHAHTKLDGMKLRSRVVELEKQIIQADTIILKLIGADRELTEEEIEYGKRLERDMD